MQKKIALLINLASGAFGFGFEYAIGEGSLDPSKHKNLGETLLILFFCMLIASIVANILVIRSAYRERAGKTSLYVLIGIALIGAQIGLLFGGNAIGRSVRNNRYMAKKAASRAALNDAINEIQKAGLMSLESCQSFANNLPYGEEAEEILSRKPLMTIVIDSIKSDNAELQACAVKLTKRYGARARAAIPALIELIEKDENKDALSALFDIDNAKWEKYDKLLEAKAKEAELKRTAGERASYAEVLEKQLVKNYMDLSVRVSGRHNTILTISGSYFNRGAIQMLEDTVIDKGEIIKKGFKRLAYKSVDGSYFWTDWD
jgi:hypothetical protein